MGRIDSIVCINAHYCLIIIMYKLWIMVGSVGVWVIAIGKMMEHNSEICLAVSWCYDKLESWLTEENMCWNEVRELQK